MDQAKVAHDKRQFRVPSDTCGYHKDTLHALGAGPYGSWARQLTGISEGGRINNPRPVIFGVAFDPLSMDETVARCRDLIESGRPVQHVVLNAGKVVMMHKNSRLKETIATCPVVNADGQSIVWAGRLLGIAVPERVAGIDLMERLLGLAAAEKWPVFFLGARAGVLGKFLRVVATRFPKLLIAGSHDGYFDEDKAITDEIRVSGARLLFVGISSPKKEFFLAEQLPSMGTVFAMGVGGSFDVWAGKAKRAPNWMQRFGLEWFYRFLQEPRRMWRRYLIGNSVFFWLVVREFFTRRTAKRSGNKTK